MAHVVQGYSYDKEKRPTWLVEGIADYIRYFTWEPAANRGRIDPNQAKYTNGYKDAAAFLDWIQRTYDKDFVALANTALRDGSYTTDFFKMRTQKDLETLWAEFLASLRK